MGGGRVRQRWVWSAGGGGDSLCPITLLNSVFCAWAGLDEGISSIIFIIIIVALGVGVITIALYLNYRPCRIQRRKLPYRQKEKNKEEESQFAVQRAEKCNARNC